MSRGVVIARILVVVLLLSAVVGCLVYFLAIKPNNQNKDSTVFADYNVVFNSTNQIEIDKNLGGLENGNYFTYASSQTGVKYKETYLNYYLNKQVMESYAYLLITTTKNEGQIKQLLNNYKAKAEVLLRSQQLFNTTRAEYGNNPTAGEQQAILTNFNVMLKDFDSLSHILRDLADLVFVSVTSSYYVDTNEFKSAQYTLSYCLNIQGELLDTAVSSQAGVSEALYQDSLAMVKEFTLKANNDFVCQSKDANVVDMLKKFALKDNRYQELLNSTDKATFVNNIEDATKRAENVAVLNCLGLAGRL